MRFENRGHNDILYDQTNTYFDEFCAEFDKWLEMLDYDYKAEDNKLKFKEDKAKYINENLDREKFSHRLDENLFGQFLDFYEHAII